LTGIITAPYATSSSKWKQENKASSGWIPLKILHTFKSLALQMQTGHGYAFLESLERESCLFWCLFACF